MYRETSSQRIRKDTNQSADNLHFWVLVIAFFMNCLSRGNYQTKCKKKRFISKVKLVEFKRKDPYS